MAKKILPILTFLLAINFLNLNTLAQETDDKKTAPQTIVKKEPSTLQKINGAVAQFFFYDISFGAFKKYDDKGQVIVKNGKEQTVAVPLLIAFLAFGSLFFTFFFKFVNVKMFRHCIDVIRGKYDNPKDEGQISHFAALTSALSATVGLGNIAAVAIAISVGGPGAMVWMIILAFFGMSAKFTSASLAQYYRQKNSDGSISGGPMYYLDIGLKEKKLPVLGKILGVMFALCLMIGALGGGGMFQSNQSFSAFYDTFVTQKNLQYSKEAKEEDKPVTKQQKIEEQNFKSKSGFAFGILIAFLVGIVLIGGVSRIGKATSRIVPFMCGLYIVVALAIIISNITALPKALGIIFSMAFAPGAALGGVIGVMMQGFKRAAFSNEAGLGSAAIVHAAAKTDEPIREGIVAMIGPFIDTIIICSTTALVVVITGAWELGTQGYEGIEITLRAFSDIAWWFPVILTICIILFAYSTMIAWCYYGERAWIYVLDHFGKDKGLKTVIAYRIIFLGAVFYGCINSLSDVIDFSDLLFLSMAFPNIIGAIILAPTLKDKLASYIERYKKGEFKTYK